ncbi:MAG: hypothetical protein GYB67_18875 [Chloroflexi bacterium]|nr:hypothetical protein [Chloroflexota bacterium]
MSLSRLLVRLLPISAVAAAVIAASLLLVDTPEIGPTSAYACNPCECPNDQRHNCLGGEFYAVYTYSYDDLCVLDVYRIDSDGGRRIFMYDERELSRVPDFPDRNLFLVQVDGVAMYRLTSGEYQINAGPDVNNKMFVLRFDDCPATYVEEESWVNGRR